MNKKLVLSLMLATGLAFAQSGSSSGSQSSSTPSTQPSQQTPSQQPSTSSTDQSSQTSTVSSNSQDKVLRGCLKQSGGNWVLSSNGQNITLNGDDSTLKPHDGHQVEVQGTRGSDGSSLTVKSGNMISDTCSTSQAPSGMPAPNPATPPTPPSP